MSEIVTSVSVPIKPLAAFSLELLEDCELPVFRVMVDNTACDGSLMVDRDMIETYSNNMQQTHFYGTDCFDWYP